MSEPPAPPPLGPAIPEPHRPPSWAPIALVAFVGLVICTNVANAVWSRWIDDQPEALLALSSRQRYLILSVAGGISPAAYVLIGALRIALAFVVCHLLGRAYREQALTWLVRMAGLTPQALATYQRHFDRLEIGLVPFFAGSNIVAVLTGVHRTRPGRLALLLAVGIAGRLALMWWLAKVFEEQLLDFFDFVERYQWPVLIVSVLLVVLSVSRNMRTGRAR